jgi:hypothetical protein
MLRPTFILALAISLFGVGVIAQATAASLGLVLYAETLSLDGAPLDKLRPFGMPEACTQQHGPSIAILHTVWQVRNICNP